MLVQTNPVNRITNLPKFLCVFNRSIQVSVSDKYPQVYRLATQRAQNSVPSPRWTFVCGLSSPNKLKTPKLKCVPEISVVFIYPYSVLFCNLWSEQYLPLFPRIPSPYHFWYVGEEINVFEAWAVLSLLRNMSLGWNFWPCLGFSEKFENVQKWIISVYFANHVWFNF